MTSWLFVSCFNLLITRYHLVPSHWPCITLTWLVLKQYEQLAGPPTLFLCKLCAFTLYMWTALWQTWCLDTNKKSCNTEIRTALDMMCIWWYNYVFIYVVLFTHIYNNKSWLYSVYLESTGNHKMIIQLNRVSIIYKKGTNRFPNMKFGNKSHTPSVGQNIGWCK